MRQIFFLVLATFSFTHTFGQKDTIDEKTMDAVIISLNKWQQKLNEVPNKVVKVSKPDIIRNNPQTSADLLGQSGAVFIQKSQLGGGSPMIRGFATNRVLIVADGVRMNNAIYRSGNLQNVISIDPLSIETAEVIFGPGSIIYGSDAIGGVMDFHTIDPKFSNTKKTLITGSALARYSTADNEKTIHADLNAGWQKWALVSSFTHSSFGDLKMGKHGKEGEENYLRPEYVKRINNKDSIFKNDDPRIQRFSGYDQTNLLQKISFRPDANWDLTYSFTHARTGDAPRYDRLIQYRSGALRFAEWHYGPMLWNMHTLNVLHTKKSPVYDKAKLTIAYQDYEESRIDRTRNKTSRSIQTELVDAFSINLDATKTLKQGEIFYGLEYVTNKVGSTGEVEDIISGTTTAAVSRYPDGSKWRSLGLYSSYKINLHPRVTLSSGLRYSYNALDAEFDKTFIPFPFEKAKIRDGALTGNAGIVYRPDATWQLNANISTGYRMPNIDDIGKLFESVPGNVTMPNPELTPEYAWNFEIGIVKNVDNKYRVELNAFHTILSNAIVRRPGTFNGQDSILFDNVMRQVEMLQNVASAHVSGVQAAADISLGAGVSLRSNANWITGKETDDSKDEQVALRHAPPFYGSTALRYRQSGFFAEFSWIYNGAVTNKNLSPSEQGKGYMYAKDANGLPYSPGWNTLNLKASFRATHNLTLTAGWENITNQRYRPYSSGIVAAGSNLIFAVRVNW
ncbi:MAG: TonB-dependent receptor [Chitinophagaceae bacterium]|nr:TonB-dependent receptor [Chitinophagaceae bacterium]